eukprot:GHVR01126206.1.p1 GENE.GHVR01126206.1~~GHVR01126206.1.p1  ORF type:complete len:106 (+),score=4.31 GHVR01126206.1:263-580(+)
MCLRGDKFKNLATNDDQIAYRARLRDLGYRLSYANIGGNSSRLTCPMVKRRVNDLAGTSFHSWSENVEPEGQDGLLTSMLNTDFAWLNGARCYCSCCIANTVTST